MPYEFDLRQREARLRSLEQDATLAKPIEYSAKIVDVLLEGGTERDYIVDVAGTNVPAGLTKLAFLPRYPSQAATLRQEES